MSRERTKTATVGLLLVLFGAFAAICGYVLTFVWGGLLTILLVGLGLAILGVLVIALDIRGR